MRDADVLGGVLRIPTNRADNSGLGLNLGINHQDFTVAIDPNLRSRGETRWNAVMGTGGVIVLREWNEQVLLHEILHVALDGVIPHSEGDLYGHNVIARAEVALWETGWRLTSVLPPVEKGRADA